MYSNLHTVVIICIFALGYLYFVARKTARQQLDIYDLIMLSTGRNITFSFRASTQLGRVPGSTSRGAFPFVIMFGAAVCHFVYLYPSVDSKNTPS